MSNEVVVGPILGFRGLTGGRWLTSALVVSKGDATPPQLKFTVGGNPLKGNRATLLKTFADRHVWRLDWGVQQISEEQPVDYSIDDGATFRYVVPGLDKPLRIAYGSCFGFSDIKHMKKVKEKDGMWTVLRHNHEAKPYHLMLMGGDQVYADEMWVTVPPLKAWFDKSIKKRMQAPFTAQMERLTERFYFSDLYCQRWAQKVTAAVMSQIPSLMMWDDHDIFDGWGSYPQEQQECEVFKGIYRQAREHFRIFQLQARDDTDLGVGTLLAERGFTYAYRIGDVAIIALDMRSERTQDQVMSLETWNRAQDWMYQELTKKTNQDGSERPACKHLLVMSSIPVVYVNANMLETAFGLLPGQQDLEDDFKDQWLSRTHQEERIRLIHRLLKFSKESGCRVTILSGDVHVAALGYIQSERDRVQFDEANVINQFISSAMVHTPPSGIVIYMMEKVLGDKVEEVDRGITARMLKFPGSARRFVGARNWLSITFDEQNRIWGEWYVEGEDRPYTKVVHPIGALTS